jgi:ABC-type antimicrobial peptide transport system permease subunit
VGAAGSLFLTRLIRTLLFAIPKNDYLGLTFSTALIFLVAMLAAAVPSYRASRTDPLLALKNE